MSYITIIRPTWTTFKSNLKKIKKSAPKYKFKYFRKWNFLPKKNLNKTEKSLTPKNLIKFPRRNWMLEKPLDFISD